MQPEVYTPPVMQPPQKSHKKLIIIITAVIVGIGLIIGGIFLVRMIISPAPADEVLRPSKPTIGVIDTTQLFVSWQKVEGATNYTLQCAKGTFDKDVISVDTTKTTASCDDLIEGAQYVVRVAATVGGTTTPYSDVTTVSTARPLPTPASITFKATSSTTISYSFTKVTGAITYEVQLATDTGFTKDRITLDVQETSGSFEGLTPSTKYYLHARALKTGPVQNTTPYSEVQTITTPK